jgi:hypothetical protein
VFTSAAAPNPANEKEMWPADDFCRVCHDGGSVIVCDDCGFGKSLAQLSVTNM